MLPRRALLQRQSKPRLLTRQQYIREQATPLQGLIFAGSLAEHHDVPKYRAAPEFWPDATSGASASAAANEDATIPDAFFVSRAVLTQNRGTTGTFERGCGS